MEAAIKSQDIPVLLQVLLLGPRWKYEALETSLGLSKSALHRSLSRCSNAQLLSDSQTQIFTANFIELLVHGVKYIFPAQVGKIVRGIATAHSTAPLNNLIKAETDVFVWPFPKGKIKGASIEPLYKLLPAIVESNKPLYEMLALIDAIRVGRAREVQIASKLLQELINQYGKQFNQ